MNAGLQNERIEVFSFLLKLVNYYCVIVIQLKKLSLLILKHCWSYKLLITNPVTFVCFDFFLDLFLQKISYLFS